MDEVEMLDRKTGWRHKVLVSTAANGLAIPTNALPRTHAGVDAFTERR